MLSARFVILPILLAASVGLSASQPIVVSFEQLKKTPWKYNGKRISITGYLDEEAIFTASPNASDAADIFIDVTKVRATKLSRLQTSQLGNRYFHIVGIFQHLDLKGKRSGRVGDRVIISRPYGFSPVGAFENQITELTEMTPVAK